METNRLLLLVALGLVSFLLWQNWQLDYGPKPISAEAEAAAVAGEESSPTPMAPAPIPVESDDGETGSSQTAQPQLKQTTTNLTQDKLVSVKTDLYQVWINLNGGGISQMDLLQYPVELDKPDLPFRLMGGVQPRVYLVKSGLLDDKSQEIPKPGTLYQSEQQQYELGDKQKLIVSLTWSNDQGLKTEKRFIFHRGKYEITIEHILSNHTQQAWSGGTYARIERDHSDKTGFLPTYNGTALYSEENKFEKWDFDDIKEYKDEKGAAMVRPGIKDGWVGMLEHYFVSAIIPERGKTYTLYTDLNQRPTLAYMSGFRYWVGVVSSQQRIEPQGQHKFSLKIFAGPKLQGEMAQAAEGLALTVDYGFLTFLSEPLFWVMAWIHSWVQNWGWSIIFVTLLIKLAFYPLSAASYRSMAKMKKLAPRMQALKERYGDDKQQMSKAMMAMYKKEGANPLGGCLPILLQIPVFLALYWVLLESVELRQAPFMLWIQDLSSKDPFFVLPVLMGASMLLQQKLNPPQMDPMQQKIMQMLPIIFTIFTTFFPSGLVLYWLANNVLSIAQQWFITQSMEKKTAKK